MVTFFHASFCAASFEKIGRGVLPPGSAKSDQIPQQHFAAQDAVRTAEQITAQAATDKTEPKKVLTGA